MGAGALGLIAGAAMEWRAWSDASDSEGKCPSAGCPNPTLRQDALDLNREGKTWEAVGIASLAVGVIGVAAGVYLLFLRKDPPQSRASAARPALLLGGGKVAF
jgi:hypothetical protein